MRRLKTLCLLTGLAAYLWLGVAKPAEAALHLWHVKEVFTNAAGSVQFIEMFDSFGGENFVADAVLRANSDGVIKDFTFPDNLNFGTSTAGKHILIATSGFGSLPGAVAPDFTFDQGGVSGSFFNPNAANITFTFFGSGDSMAVTGAALPKNGINSLTDSGASGFPPGTPNITSGVNSPTNFSANATGSVNLSAPSPTGDYDGNHVVDANDYVVWRKTLNGTVSPHGSGADGDANGTIGPGDYTYWRTRFGNTVPGSGSLAGGAVPEPTAVMLQCGWLLALVLRVRKRTTPRMEPPC